MATINNDDTITCMYRNFQAWLLPTDIYYMRVYRKGNGHHFYVQKKYECIRNYARWKHV